MNVKLSLCLLFATILPFSNGGEIRLLNGDRVQGALLQVDGADCVIAPRWSEETIRIPGKYLGYSLRVVTNTAETVSADSLIRLTNGDQFRARFQGLNSNLCSVTTSWGQETSVMVPMVESIRFFERGRTLLLSGFGDPGAWIWRNDEKAAPGSNRFAAGRLTIPTTANASRRFTEVPEQYHLSVSLRSAKNQIMINLIPFGSNPFQQSLGDFMLQFNRGGVYCSFFNSTGRQNLWNHRSQDLAGQGSDSMMHVDLYGNRKTREYVLVVNDEMIKRWTVPEVANTGQDPQPDPSSGWLNFLGNYLGEIELSNLLIESWDGGVPALNQHEQKEDMDLLVLRNGDAVSGTVQSTIDGVVAVEIPGVSRALSIDTKRVVSIQFAPKTRQRARRNNRDVEVSFGASGERLTLNLTSLNQTEIRGTSEVWSDEVVLNRQIADLIRFNIYLRRRLDNAAFAEEWIFAPANGNSSGRTKKSRIDDPFGP